MPESAVKSFPRKLVETARALGARKVPVNFVDVLERLLTNFSQEEIIIFAASEFFRQFSEGDEKNEKRESIETEESLESVIENLLIEMEVAKLVNRGDEDIVKMYKHPQGSKILTTIVKSHLAWQQIQSDEQ